MAELVCDIVTPAEKLCSQEAYMVVVPGVEGELGFMRKHEPLVSVLADGVARIQPEKDAAMLRFVLQGGYVEVTGSKVIILADRACPVSGIDVEDARTALAETEAALAELSTDEANKTRLPADVIWYKTQIHAVEAAQA